ncbi:amidophosphoribosyltransferase [Enorma phocaeensis]|uniref:Amidophosphoribosyltransferase n=1 Tax=Enorma phocaeensis TaxID=1871019 RepID=A0A921IUJ9_9ACTN|nr:amidophosphoribosyltransferase [Enorma phocaeensis]HJG36956.1 amidophosphoribosyltransferase [Enorma phocaeensis]
MASDFSDGVTRCAKREDGGRADVGRAGGRHARGRCACDGRTGDGRVDSAADDALHEECGVFGVWAPDRDVARLAYFGLKALQHRGQESAGIAVGDGGTVMVRKDLGLIDQVFSDADLSTLTGQLAVGHVRYGTAGAKSWEAAQPHLSTINDVIIALAHNGTLVNTDELRRQLIDLGVPFLSNSDSEVATKLIGYFTQRTKHLREGIRKTMELIRGGYAMTLINEQALYAFRDPYGIRPLVLGKLPAAEDGDSQEPATEGWIVASETCALDIVGAEYVRDIRPGEILRISAEGLVSEQGVPAAAESAECIFEQVYFARPDSIMGGKSVYACRYDMGRRLALEAPVEADMVIGVPDSGLPPAEGYAHESGIPFGEGLIKNRYVARTFIQPTQELRAMGVRMKLNPLRDNIAGKRLVVIDDSIVRGTTMVQLVKMLRQAGAAEVHVRINSPEVVWPCFYGIDTDVQAQLISANKSVEEIRAYIGADSLAFLSVEGLLACVPQIGEPVCGGCAERGYCTACFTGVYPVAIPDSFGRDKFMPGYDPLNFTTPEPVSGHCVTEKERDRSWETAHGEA